MEKIKLYIADNSENYSKELMEYFAEKFNVVGHATDGNNALEFLKNNDVDILLLDVVLGGIDGFEVLSALKNLNKNTKVIISSNLTHDSFIAKAINEGASYFMIKPVEKTLLEKRITELANAENVKQPTFTKISKNKFLERKNNQHFYHCWHSCSH